MRQTLRYRWLCCHCRQSFQRNLNMEQLEVCVRLRGLTHASRQAQAYTANVIAQCKMNVTLPKYFLTVPIYTVTVKVSQYPTAVAKETKNIMSQCQRDGVRVQRQIKNGSNDQLMTNAVIIGSLRHIKALHIHCYPDWN